MMDFLLYVVVYGLKCAWYVLPFYLYIRVRILKKQVTTIKNKLLQNNTK
jgi:hypothetical protein